MTNDVVMRVSIEDYEKSTVDAIANIFLQKRPCLLMIPPKDLKREQFDEIYKSYVKENHFNPESDFIYSTDIEFVDDGVFRVKRNECSSMKSVINKRLNDSPPLDEYKSLLSRETLSKFANGNDSNGAKLGMEDSIMKFMHANGIILYKEGWNLSNLGSPLGITSRTVMTSGNFVSPITFEPYDLPKISLLLPCSNPMLWVVYPRESQAEMNRRIVSFQESCETEMLHNRYMIELEQLEQLEPRPIFVLQKPNQYMVIAPGACYQTVSMGLTISEEVNFFTTGMFSSAMTRKRCVCRDVTDQYLKIPDVVAKYALNIEHQVMSTLKGPNVELKPEFAKKRAQEMHIFDEFEENIGRRYDVGEVQQLHGNDVLQEVGSLQSQNIHKHAFDYDDMSFGETDSQKSRQSTVHPQEECEEQEHQQEDKDEDEYDEENQQISRSTSASPPLLETSDEQQHRLSTMLLHQRQQQQSRPASVSPIQSRPASVSPIQSRPASVSPIQSRPASVSPIQSRPASVSPIQSRPASVSPIQSRPASVTPALDDDEEVVQLPNVRIIRYNTRLKTSRPVKRRPCNVANIIPVRRSESSEVIDDVVVNSLDDVHFSMPDQDFDSVNGDIPSQSEHVVDCNNVTTPETGELYERINQILNDPLPIVTPSHADAIDEIEQQSQISPLNISNKSDDQHARYDNQSNNSDVEFGKSNDEYARSDERPIVLNSRQREIERKLKKAIYSSKLHRQNRENGKGVDRTVWDTGRSRNVTDVISKWFKGKMNGINQSIRQYGAAIKRYRETNYLHHSYPSIEDAIAMLAGKEEAKLRLIERRELANILKKLFCENPTALSNAFNAGLSAEDIFRNFIDPGSSVEMRLFALSAEAAITNEKRREYFLELVENEDAWNTYFNVPDEDEYRIPWKEWFCDEEESESTVTPCAPKRKSSNEVVETIPMKSRRFSSKSLASIGTHANEISTQLQPNSTEIELSDDEDVDERRNRKLEKNKAACNKIDISSRSAFIKSTFDAFEFDLEILTDDDLTEYGMLGVRGREFRKLNDEQFLSDQLMEDCFLLLSKEYAFCEIGNRKILEDPIVEAENDKKKSKNIRFFFMPLHKGGHFILYVADIKHARCFCYDPLYQYHSGLEIFQHAIDCLTTYVSTRFNVKLREYPTDVVPRQRRCRSCGVYVIMKAKHLLQNKPNEEVPSYARKLIAAELLYGNVYDLDRSIYNDGEAYEKDEDDIAAERLIINEGMSKLVSFVSIESFISSSFEAFKFFSKNILPHDVIGVRNIPYGRLSTIRNGKQMSPSAIDEYFAMIEERNDTCDWLPSIQTVDHYRSQSNNFKNIEQNAVNPVLFIAPIIKDGYGALYAADLKSGSYQIYDPCSKAHREYHFMKPIDVMNKYVELRYGQDSLERIESQIENTEPCSTDSSIYICMRAEQFARGLTSLKVPKDARNLIIAELLNGKLYQGTSKEYAHDEPAESEDEN